MGSWYYEVSVLCLHHEGYVEGHRMFNGQSLPPQRSSQGYFCNMSFNMGWSFHTLPRTLKSYCLKFLTLSSYLFIIILSILYAHVFLSFIMFSKWLQSNRYIVIPQNVTGDDTLEKHGESSISLCTLHNNLLEFTRLISLSLLFGLAGFAIGMKVFRHQNDFPMPVDTVPQGLILVSMSQTTLMDSFQCPSVGLERPFVTMIALRAQFQTRTDRSRYGTL